MAVEKLSILVKKLRESRNLTIMQLAEKSGLGNGTIGDIESGRSKGSRKSLNKIAEALNLTSEERGRLDSAFLGREVTGSLDSRVNSLGKRERLQLEELLQENAMFFSDDKISDEDKEKFFASLQEVFFTIKLANKKNNK